MPTIQTVTVKSSGGDYTSLAAAEAGEQTNLVTADVQLDIECYAMSDTSRVVVDGWTTDATRYIRIFTPTSERHDGKWNTSKYRYEITSGFAGFFQAFANFEGHTRIDGLQIHAAPDVNGRQALVSAVSCLVSNCLVRVVPGSTTGHTGIAITTSGSDSKVWNNIIYQETLTTGSVGLFFGADSFLFNHYAYNNTIHGWATGISRDAGNAIIAKNNLVNGCTTCYGSVYDASSTNNVSSDATSPNTSHRQRVAVFRDAGNFDFRPVRHDHAARSRGRNLSRDLLLAFSDDASGQPRQAWDAGALERYDSHARRQVNAISRAIWWDHTPRTLGHELPAGMDLWFAADSSLWQDSARTTPATADGDPIGAWDDDSGNDFHALQPTSGNRPTLQLNEANGFPVVRFDGTDNYLEGDIGATDESFSLYLVAKERSAPTASIRSLMTLGTNVGAQIYTYITDGSGWLYYDAAVRILGGTPTNLTLIELVFSSNAVAEPFLDGVAGSQFDPGDYTRTHFILGSLNAGTFAGDFDIAEVMRFNSALSAGDRRTVRIYLADKYGINAKISRTEAEIIAKEMWNHA